MAIIQTQQLSVPGRLTNLDLSLAANQVIGLIGPNGAGKSTLLQVLAGLLKYSGQVALDHQPLAQLKPTERARRIGYLPQQQHSAWSLRVSDIVTLGRLPWGDQDEQAIAAAIDGTGIRPLLDKPIHHLSGGQQARVWLARVLAGQPKLLLADEPLASLDIAYQRQIMTLLTGYAAQGNTVLVAVHDLNLAARYCDQLVLLHEGQLIQQGTPAKVLTPAHLRLVYQVEARVDFASQPPMISLY